MEVSPDLLQRMMDVISHRGPDGEGKYLFGPVGLGHPRLAIIDLNTGAQPMTNEDGTVWIVFNGEFTTFPNFGGSCSPKDIASLLPRIPKSSFTYTKSMAWIACRVCGECSPSRFGTKKTGHFLLPETASASSRFTTLTRVSRCCLLPRSSRCWLILNFAGKWSANGGSVSDVSLSGRSRNSIQRHPQARSWPLSVG